MCSARVSPVFVLRAFQQGADGVLVTGCHIGDCHYISGNEKAEKNMGLTAELLELLGIGSDRLRLEWVSAGEGVRFAAVMTSFVEQIKKLGKLELKSI